MSPAIVEKDFWVCWTLGRLFASQGTGVKSCFLTFQRSWSVLTVTREAGYESGFSHESSAARSEVSPPRIRNSEFGDITLISADATLAKESHAGERSITLKFLAILGLKSIVNADEIRD